MLYSRVFISNYLLLSLVFNVSHVISYYIVALISATFFAVSRFQIKQGHLHNKVFVPAYAENTQKIPLYSQNSVLGRWPDT